MSNSLQIFKYNDNDVRTIQIDGEPWWVLRDICDVLGLTTPARVAERLDGDEVSLTHITDSLGRQQQTAIVNESGLYNVIIRSDKPEARNFRRWITHEVLPSIRRTGAYLTAPAMKQLISDPTALIMALTAYQEEMDAHAETRAAKEHLQLEAEVNAPKVILADAITVSQGTILIRELAKILKGNGIDIGEKRLFEKLREGGYLIKKRGSDYNSPTQMAMELGLFVVHESVVPQCNNSMILCRTPRVTGKGQQYFVNWFLTQNNLKEAL